MPAVAADGVGPKTPGGGGGGGGNGGGGASANEIGMGTVWIGAAEERSCGGAAAFTTASWDDAAQPEGSCSCSCGGAGWGWGGCDVCLSELETGSGTSAAGECCSDAATGEVVGPAAAAPDATGEQGCAEKDAVAWL